MKATIDIPDDLFRRVKAKSALEGRAIREVTAELFRRYLGEQPADPEVLAADSPAAADRPELPSWFGIARRHIDPRASHDWEEIRGSIERGWAGEVAEPAPPSPPSRKRGRRG